jgi:hypothetical protein
MGREKAAAKDDRAYAGGRGLADDDDVPRGVCRPLNGTDLVPVMESLVAVGRVEGTVEAAEAVESMAIGPMDPVASSGIVDVGFAWPAAD